MKQFVYQYTAEIEFHQNPLCEQILALFYEILEAQVNKNYRFSKQVYEYNDNTIIKLTKRLLFGPESERNTYSEMPSMLLVNSQTLAIRIFMFIGSMSESGLTDITYFISVMDISSFQQTNLREIQDSLSQTIIKTKTVLDNPIPK